MSFGDGNLHEQVERLKGAADYWADKSKSAELHAIELAHDIDRLKELNGELCAEVNEKDGRIRELESENAALRRLIADIRLYNARFIANEDDAAEQIELRNSIAERLKEHGIKEVVA